MRIHILYLITSIRSAYHAASVGRSNIFNPLQAFSLDNHLIIVAVINGPLVSNYHLIRTHDSLIAR